MDTQKIGAFFKELRREKGLTQEQLAEILHVSGRTVSRWETGRNMPDLSILIEMAEFYHVEVKELIDGERKGERMDKELKETLIKVADYNKAEKEKAVKVGNTAFAIMYAICAVMIVIQLAVTANLAAVAGETAVLLIGGAVYLGITVYNGLWGRASSFKDSPFGDALISAICAGIFTIFLSAAYLRMGANMSQTVRVGLIFFVAIAIVGNIVLRTLSCFSRKRKESLSDSGENEETRPRASGNISVKENGKRQGDKKAAEKENAKETDCVSVFTADGTTQAEMILHTLKENDVLAYGQDLGDAGFASVRYGMGRGIDDGIAILVPRDQSGRAIQIIKEMGFE